MFVIIECQTIHNNNTKKKRIDVYVLSYMVETRDTAHFETSLLNTDACLNAVQSFNNNTEAKIHARANTKEEENWK